MGVTAPEILCKQPSELRLYTMEFANLLDTSAGEIISNIDGITSEVIGDTGLVSDLNIFNSGIVDGKATSSMVQMWIESGTHYHAYRVEVQVSTNAGQKLEGDGVLLVRDT